MPNAGGKHVQGSQILEFEVPYDGPAPTVVVDCQSPYAFDMYQVRGEPLPRRACPLRPKGVTAGPDGPPPEWLESWFEHPPEGKERIGRRWEPTMWQPTPPEGVIERYGRIKSVVFDSGDPEKPLQPSDRFAVISVSVCNDCHLASGGTVAVKKEQDAIRNAFHAQLQLEDFSDFPQLADDDAKDGKDPWGGVRDHRAWNIHWEEISIIG
jgi:hypothetical protein